MLTITYPSLETRVYLLCRKDLPLRAYLDQAYAQRDLEFARAILDDSWTVKEVPLLRATDPFSIPSVPPYTLT